MVNRVMRPDLLQRGDKVAIVAPSRVIDKTQMEHAYKVFSEWGLEVQDGNNLYNKSGYFAGTDEQRLSDLQDMLSDTSMKAIFCARGGFGMTKIIDDLDLSDFKKNPKWVIGFSDITALHLALNRLKIESVHGLMPVQFGNKEVGQSIDSLKKLLFEGKGEVISQEHMLNIEGNVQAELVGGNLSLVVESLGTPTEINTEGKILFLEEIDEYLYKIDRMFNQLRRAGKFDHLKGLVIGDFSSMKDTAIPFGTNIYGLIAKYINSWDIPVALNVPIGHEDYNLAVPVSRVVKFSVDKDGARINF